MINTVLGRVFETVQTQNDENSLNFYCSIEKLESSCFAMRCHFSYLWLIDINAVHRLNHPSEFSLKYSFYDADSSQFFTLSTDSLREGEAQKPISSLVHLWKNAVVFEQELFELFNLRFSRDFESFYLRNFQKGVLRKDFNIPVDREHPVPYDESVKHDMTINLSSLFFRNHNKAFLSVEGNDVLSCQLECGNYHIGLEKIMEGAEFHEGLNFMESYFSKISPFCSLAICLAAEKGLAVKVPDRARAIRMASIEINRIFCHLAYLRNICHELSLESGYSTLKILMKKLQALIVSYSGHEFGHFLIRVGGVTRDVQQDWVSRTVNELQAIEGFLLNLKTNLFDTQVNKLKLSFQIVSKKEAAAWNLTGPLARATGLNLDFRKSDPFYFYNDVEFDIPIGVKGTGHDLVDVRLEEIFQSIRIIGQVLDNLPTGQILCDKFSPLFLDKDNGLSINEKEYRESIDQFQVVNKLNQSQYLEGPDGLLGVDYIIENALIERFHFITPSRLNKRVFEKSVMKRSFDELIPYWATFGISLKEAER